MRYIITAVLLIIFISLGISLTDASFDNDDNECTILVISGNATDDGRPVIWKNRDVTNANQKYLYIPSRYTPNDTSYGFIGNFYTDDSSRCYMGVNEKGFAIINANCYNLPDNLADGIDDGQLMHFALEQCQNVEEWEFLLDLTNLIGRKNPWIFGVMDASGEAKLYECGNFNYYMYDANDPEDAPSGILVRSVFAMAGWQIEEGVERYKRTVELVTSETDPPSISVKYILKNIARDFCTANSDPYPLPFLGEINDLPKRFVSTEETINRWKSRSCSVIRGVRGDEDPQLATTFAILGQPALSVAVPLWVASKTVPNCLSGGESAPWFLLVNSRMQYLYPIEDNNIWMNTAYLLDTCNTGVYTYSLALENWAIDQANQKLDLWYGQQVDSMTVRTAQDQISEIIWINFNNGENYFVETKDNKDFLPGQIELYNYPNPFNASTTIRFNLGETTECNSAAVTVYNVLGEKVAHLDEIKLINGGGSVLWNGENDNGYKVSAGVYFYQVESEGTNITGKMLYLK